MSIFTGADYYIRHDQEPDVDPKVLEGLTVEKLTTLVNKVSLNNSDLHNEAIRKADSYSFSTAHPELMQTAKNNKLINHWLDTKGISQPSYPDFDAAFTALSAENLLQLDAAELARDKNTHREFRGVFTGQIFDSVDNLIIAERQAALQNVRPDGITPEELALEQMPLEQVKILLREGARQEQRKPKLIETRLNGDAWYSLNPWYVDNERNAHLMKMQLAANGFPEDASIEQFEICARQLRESDLLTTNKSAVAKERVAEVAQRASEAVQQHGTVFDNTSEEEMWNLPLEELKRRANGIYA